VRESLRLEGARLLDAETVFWDVVVVIATAAGMWFGDYFQKGLRITNADTQSTKIGIETPYFSHGETIIENSYIRAHFGIWVGTMWTVAGSGGLPAKTITISNVRFDSVFGASSASILMGYDPGDGHNVIKRDEVFVYDYNRHARRQLPGLLLPAGGRFRGAPDRFQFEPQQSRDRRSRSWSERPKLAPEFFVRHSVTGRVTSRHLARSRTSGRPSPSLDSPGIANSGRD
jgi:hypothetical protein